MTTKKELTLAEWVADLNSDPDPKYIKDAEDGSGFRYLPIDYIESKLDKDFYGKWDFQMLRETYLSNFARGYGIITVTCPVDNSLIIRGGDAAIMLSGDYEKESPLLEALVLSSCARKLGISYGRNINRNKQTLVRRGISVSMSEQEKLEWDAEEKEMEAKLSNPNLSKADALVILESSYVFKNNVRMKKLINEKK